MDAIPVVGRLVRESGEGGAVLSPVTHGVAVTLQHDPGALGVPRDVPVEGRVLPHGPPILPAPRHERVHARSPVRRVRPREDERLGGCHDLEGRLRVSDLDAPWLQVHC